MSTLELTNEIVKTALENNKIAFLNRSSSNEDEIARQNCFNAKQISDFYQVIFDTVNSALN